MERFLYPALTDLKDFFWSRDQVILLVGDTPRNRKGEGVYYLPVAERILCLISVCSRKTGSARFNMKLHAHRAELPGKVISFYIVPLEPAYKAGLAGHVPAKKKLNPHFIPSQTLAV